MSHPISIAFLHGIGRTERGYSGAMQDAILRQFRSLIAAETPHPEGQILFEEINWSAALQFREDRLWEKLVPGGPMRYPKMRRFLVDFAADAIAYQPAPSDRSAYDAIHREVASALARLAERAGPRAPLCVIAHSLGTVIASNYLYDLWKPRGSFMSPSVRRVVRGTPLERGETLCRLFTMGSPIALWSLRYPRFGDPIAFPLPALKRHHPSLEAAWINFYDADDVIGYPLKPLNAGYASIVTEDRAVDVGSILTRWNPLSHVGYWNNGGLAVTIADSLAAAWRQSSALSLVNERRDLERVRRRVQPKRRRRVV